MTFCRSDVLAIWFCSYSTTASAPGLYGGNMHDGGDAPVSLSQKRYAARLRASIQNRAKYWHARGSIAERRGPVMPSFRISWIHGTCRIEKPRALPLDSMQLLSMASSS